MARKDREEQEILDRSGIDRKQLEDQRAVLVGVGLQSEDKSEYLDSLAELMDLTETAGAEVVATTSQVLEKYNSGTLIGKGKVTEIKNIVKETEANLVIIDKQLTGQQAVKLESEVKVAVIDRTQLILDIFAQRAQSHEGKIQVELAQMLDQLPRMVGAWMGSLSRQGGGIGTRGPGETALEMDRRRIRKRVEIIRSQLKTIQKRREQHRASRRRNQVPSFALIGYTNAGKSTLLNQITQSEIYAKDQLFATLDPTTRKVFLPDGPNAVITDTVGFIRRLPTKLIEAFKATLEESGDADILLHIIDSNHPNMEKHIEVVEELINEFQWSDKQVLYVYNKMDLVKPEQKLKLNRFPRVFISAQKNQGMDELKSKMTSMIEQLQEEYELFFPNEDRYKLFELARESKLLRQEEASSGVVVKVRLTPNGLHRWNEYLVKKQIIS
ncbi:MAG: GTPase HflX [Bdellovibrionales bacterium]